MNTFTKYVQRTEGETCAHAQLAAKAEARTDFPLGGSYSEYADFLAENFPKEDFLVREGVAYLASSYVENPTEIPAGTNLSQ